MMRGMYEKEKNAFGDPLCWSIFGGSLSAKLFESKYDNRKFN